MNILVTGAAGYIGRKFVQAVSGKPWAGKTVGLDIGQPGSMPADMKFVKRDVRSDLDDVFAEEKIDTVVHLAFVVPPIHDNALMEDINKGGLRNVLAASARAGVKQILHLSSATAYGFHADNDDPLTETSPLRGNDDFTYAKNKKENEAILREFRASHPDIILANLRPSFVIGPAWKNPLAAYLGKKLVVLPANAKPIQFVHEDDLVNVMVLMLERNMNGDYNVGADGTITFAEIVRRLGNSVITLSPSVMKALNHIAWHLRLGFLTNAPSPAIQLMTQRWVVSSEKLTRETGYRFRYNSGQAFEEYALTMRS